jgi:hypothetical protein
MITTPALLRRLRRVISHLRRIIDLPGRIIDLPRALICPVAEQASKLLQRYRMTAGMIQARALCTKIQSDMAPETICLLIEQSHPIVHHKTWRIVSGEKRHRRNQRHSALIGQISMIVPAMRSTCRE